MADQATNEMLKSLTVEDINAEYRSHQITAAVRNKVLLAKAHVTIADKLANEGFAKAVLTETLRHVQEGWEDFKAGVVMKPGEAPDTRHAMKALWGSIQIAASGFTALGDVTGQEAENLALSLGSSPGVARVVNFAANTATSLFPVGKANQAFVKGVQALQKLTSGSKVVAAGAKDAAALAAATRAIREGLTVEGADDAAKAVKNLWSDIPRETGPAVKALSVKEQFAADYAKFHAEVSAFTATQTHEQTAKMAKKLGLTLEDLAQVVPGTALNERQMYAYLKALDPQVDTLNALAHQAKLLKTEAAENAYMQHLSDLFPLLENFRFAETTGGRAVEILKREPDIKNLTNTLLAQFNPEAMATGDRRGAIQTMVENTIALADAKNLKAATVQGHSLWNKWSDGAWPMIKEGWVNLLLPFAFIPSFVGNSIAAAQSILERKAAGMFSTSKAGVVGDETWHLMQGMKFSTADFTESFAAAFNREGPYRVGRLDVTPGAIPGVVGKIFRTPTNAVQFMDDLFKRSLTRASYYAEAVRLGRQEGLKGAELGDAIQRRVMHPTEDMMTTAKAFAEENTFQNELGKMASTVKSGLQYGPGFLYFTFMKSPINIAKSVWNRTPGLQLISKQLYEDIGAGGAKADLAMGRLIMSQMQAMFVYQLAQEGFLTGSGPVDRGARQVWLATNEPYSLRTTNGSVPLSNMDPATGQLGLVADFTQIMASLDEPTAENATMAVTYSIVKNLIDKTWFPNVSKMIDIIQTASRGDVVENKFGKIIGSPLVTLATGGPIGTRVRTTIDPVRREARGVIDEIGSKLPYFSKDHPPVRDAYGDPVTPPQPVGGTFFGAFSPLWPKSKETTTDRVKLEGEKIGAKISPFPWSLGGQAPEGFDIRTFDPTAKVGVGLTAQERDDWQEFYRQTLRDPENGIVAQVLDNPDYQEQTPAMKAKMFEAFVSAARTKGETAVQLKHPEIGIKLLNAQGASVMPLLQKQDQEDAQQTVTESISLFKSLPPDVLDNFMKYGDMSPDTPQEAAQ